MKQFVITDDRIPDVPGWFSWPEFYVRAVATAPPGSTIVEIGVFLGQSLIFLAQRARESGKNLRIVGVDTFKGSPEFEGKIWYNDGPFSAAPPGMLARECIGNLAKYGVQDDVTLLITDSVKAAGMFQDGSVHAVFVDGDHSEEGVAADIAAWRPKVRSGGMIGGDDYWSFNGVRAAVDRLVPDAAVIEGKTWWEKAC